MNPVDRKPFVLSYKSDEIGKLFRGILFKYQFNYCDFHSKLKGWCQKYGTGNYKNLAPTLGSIYFSDQDRLAHRAIDGVRSNKIRPVDYEKLRNLAAEKKFSAHKTLLKVKKFEHLSKQNKESHLLKQHKMVWQKEFIKLNSVRKRTQTDIDIHVRTNVTDTGICAQMYQEFEDYQSRLESDFAAFKTSTTEPVWNLRYNESKW